MLVVRKVVDDPRVLRGWFPPELPAGFLFLPDESDLPVGEEICLWVQLPGYAIDLYVRGVVAWRRRLGGLRPDLPHGTGLTIREGHSDELTFLGRVITGDVEPLPPRAYPRTPLLSPWHCKVLAPQMGQWFPATITDVSRGGARIMARLMPIQAGAMLEVALPWHSGSTHAMQLAWFRSCGDRLRLGLSRSVTEELHEREWNALVTWAADNFERLLRYG